MTNLLAFSGTKAFLAFRDRLGEVLKAELSIPLKPRKLDEIASHVAHFKDFNTAIGVLRDSAEESSDQDLITVLFELHYENKSTAWQRTLWFAAMRQGPFNHDGAMSPGDLIRHAHNVYTHVEQYGVRLVPAPDRQCECRWVSTPCQRVASQSFGSEQEAWDDAAISLGIAGFDLPSVEAGYFEREGWFVDKFFTEAEGWVLQLMGAEPEGESTPALSDEEAWECVTGHAKQGSAYHQQVLSWLERACPSERERIREHTGY